MQSQHIPKRSIKNFISGKWDYAFNIDKYDNSIDDVKYIEKINPIDFEDANSDTFRVDESYLADMEKFQSAEALKGLWFTYNVVPIIGLAIAVALWLFYKLNDKDVQIMADYNVGKITREEAESKLSRKY